MSVLRAVDSLRCIEATANVLNHSPLLAPLADRRVRWTASSAVFAIALVYARFAEPYYFVGDDGGITLRYATRIAEGRGFSYNDYELVNGASNLLNTWVLAGLMRAGLSAGAAVIAVGATCFAATCALLAHAALTWLSPLACAFALYVVACNPAVYADMFGGLEGPLLFALIAGYYAALKARSWRWIAVLIALLLWNKFDAGLAAIAYALVRARSNRAEVARVAALSAVLLAPVLVYLWLHFGSPLPRSALTKFVEHRTEAFDRLWFAEHVWIRVDWLLLVALPAVLVGRPATRELALWAALNACMYTLVDFGAPYPWYTAGTVMIVLVLATESVQWLAERVDALARHRLRAGAVPSALAALAVPCAIEAVRPMRGWAELARRVTHAGVGIDLPPHTRDDLARQPAGSWLRERASASELLVTPYGLPSLEYRGPVLDYSGLNSSKDDATALGAKYFVVESTTALPYQLASLPIVAELQYSLTGVRYVAIAQRDSEAARAGDVHRITALRDLVAPGAATIDARRVDGALFEHVELGSGALELAAPPGRGRRLRFHSTCDVAAHIRVVIDGAAPVDLPADASWHSVELPDTARRVVLELAPNAGPSARADICGLNICAGTPPRPESQLLQAERWTRRMTFVHEHAIPLD